MQSAAGENVMGETETTAKEIMSTRLLKARRGMTVEEVLKLLVNSKITGLPVVDRRGKMIGIISEYDIIRQLSRVPRLQASAFQAPARFKKEVEAIQEDAPLSAVIERFVTRKFRRLPVLDAKGHLVGIISRRDLMRVFYYRARLG